MKPEGVIAFVLIFVPVLVNCVVMFCVHRSMRTLASALNRSLTDDVEVSDSVIAVRRMVRFLRGFSIAIIVLDILVSGLLFFTCSNFVYFAYVDCLWCGLFLLVMLVPAVFGSLWAWKHFHELELRSSES